MSVSEPRAAELLSALTTLVRTTRVVSNKDHGNAMSGTLASILRIVARQGVRSGDLANQLMVAPSVTSRAVAALEADGLVRREADPADARACLVVLTEAGRRRLAERQQYGLQRLISALPDWDDEDVAAATQVLSRLELSLAAAPILHPVSAPGVLADPDAVKLLESEADAA
jgi:DNA-binding MarR family transcriptional regulator